MMMVVVVVIPERESERAREMQHYYIAHATNAID
jgi:hypothetical protein